jgi:hypothetical protein
MAFMKNPSFEDGTQAPWQPENIPNAVSQQLFSGGMPKSGNNVLAVSTNISGGSIRQDFPCNAPSVFAYAWVRAWSTPIAAQFTLWDGGREVSLQFTVGPNWEFITNTIGLSNVGTTRDVRFEIYIFTVNAFLLIDSANAY